MYEPSFTDRICSRMDMTGQSVADLIRKTGIKRGTMYNRLNDGNWNREQLILLNKYLRFSTEDLEAFINGR